MGMNKSYIVDGRQNWVDNIGRGSEDARGVRRRWSGSGGGKVILLRIRQVSQWI
jgi:hypothetical protein